MYRQKAPPTARKKRIPKLAAKPPVKATTAPIPSRSAKDGNVSPSSSGVYSLESSDSNIGDSVSEREGEGDQRKGKSVTVPVAVGEGMFQSTIMPLKLKRVVSKNGAVLYSITGSPTDSHDGTMTRLVEIQPGQHNVHNVHVHRGGGVSPLGGWVWSRV